MAKVINATNRFLIRRYSNLSGILKIVLTLALALIKPKAQARPLTPVVSKRAKNGRKVFKNGNYYILSAAGVYCS